MRRNQIPDPQDQTKNKDSRSRPARMIAVVLVLQTLEQPEPTTTTTQDTLPVETIDNPAKNPHAEDNDQISAPSKLFDPNN